LPSLTVLHREGGNGFWKPARVGAKDRQQSVGAARRPRRLRRLLTDDVAPHPAARFNGRRVRQSEQCVVGWLALFLRSHPELGPCAAQRRNGAQVCNLCECAVDGCWGGVEQVAVSVHAIMTALWIVVGTVWRDLPVRPHGGAACVAKATRSCFKWNDEVLTNAPRTPISDSPDGCGAIEPLCLWRSFGANIADSMRGAVACGSAAPHSAALRSADFPTSLRTLPLRSSLNPSRHLPLGPSPSLMVPNSRRI